MRLKVWRALVLLLASGVGINLQAVSQRAVESQSAPRWEAGVFAQGGFVPAYVAHFGGLSFHEDLQLYCAGIEVGRETRRFDRLGFLRGRGEALLDLIPVWIARYPPQNLTVYYFVGRRRIVLPAPPYVYEKVIYGTSITPFQLRWNFDRSNSSRVVPWVEAGGGLLWTDHQFPDFGTTSNFNFTPEVSAGVDLFRHPRRSVNVAAKFIHISNAGLGNDNPALHDTLNFSLGYSWWK